MDIEIGQVVTQIIAFLILLWVLKRYAWKPLLDVMEKREEKIRNEFASIEKQKQDNEQIRLKYEEKIAQIEALSKKLGQAEVEKGRVIARGIEEEAHKNARSIIHRGQRAALEEMLKAQQTLKKDLIKLTLAATEAILEKNIDKEKQSELIKDYLSEVHFK